MPSNLYLRFGKLIIQELLKGQISAINNIKYFQRWKNSLQPGINSVIDQQPWITFPVIDILKDKVSTNSRVFEYGGGGSTLFFVKRAKEVVTVEHDQKWFVTLKQNITNDAATNWNGNLILPEIKQPDKTLDASNPGDYYTTDENFLNNTFISYASFIDSYPDEQFDIVLVDGRARPACISHSIDKIKKGGYLVVDNSDRNYYFKNFETTFKNKFRLILNQKAASPYADFFTQTGIWQKL